MILYYISDDLPVDMIRQIVFALALKTILVDSVCISSQNILGHELNMLTSIYHNLYVFIHLLSQHVVL